MRSALVRCGALVALGWALSAGAAPTAPHAAPSRPAALGTYAPRFAALPTVRLAGLDCVSVPRLASLLRLRLVATDGGRRVVLDGGATRAVLEPDTRDITVNGLRVFLGSPVIPARGGLYVSRIDFERCLTPLLRPGWGLPPLHPPRVIVIDPGHGGRDDGKINRQLGINEKTETLDTARRLKPLLEADGYRVVLTRTDDRYVGLAERAAIANAVHADLFISLHFNAIEGDHSTSGVEVYTFAPQHQRSTASWMAGQKDDSQPTPEPVNMYDGWSVLLAQSLQRSFVGELKTFDRGRKIMHLGVLRSLHCPGTLVECGFLTSDVEARKIATPAYRERIAETVRDGVRNYSRLLLTLRSSAGPRT